MDKCATQLKAPTCQLKWEVTQ